MRVIEGVFPTRLTAREVEQLAKDGPPITIEVDNPDDPGMKVTMNTIDRRGNLLSGFTSSEGAEARDLVVINLGPDEDRDSRHATMIYSVDS